MEKGWSVLFGVVILAALVLFIVAPFVDGWWLPELANEGSFGSGADTLFYLILIATGFFFILTEGLLIYCMWKFSYSPDRRAVYTHGNHKLEVWWTLVPGVLLLVIAFTQIGVWREIKYTSQRPKPDQVIAVSARQFEWRMRYPDTPTRGHLLSKWKRGINNDELDTWGNSTHPNMDDLYTENFVHTWKDANTLIYLRSLDVLHSFFLPNLRLKQDAIPGKVIPVWFKATKSNTEFVEIEREKVGDKIDEQMKSADEGKALDGKRLFILGRDKDETGKIIRIYALAVDEDRQWELACAELCGWGHYKMRGRLFVHKDKKSYENWLKFAMEQHHTHSREN